MLVCWSQCCFIARELLLLPISLCRLFLCRVITCRQGHERSWKRESTSFTEMPLWEPMTIARIYKPVHKDFKEVVYRMSYRLDQTITGLSSNSRQVTVFQSPCAALEYGPLRGPFFPGIMILSIFRVLGGRDNLALGGLMWEPSRLELFLLRKGNHGTNLLIGSLSTASTEFIDPVM